MELQLFVTLLLVILSWFLAQDLEDVGPFGWWTAAWALMLALLVGGQYLLSSELTPLARAVVYPTLAAVGTVQVALFGLGGRKTAAGRDPRRRTVAAAVGTGVAVGAAAGTAALVTGPAAGPAESAMTVTAQLLPRSAGLALVLPYCAWSVRRSTRFGRSAAGTLVMVGFLLYGANHLVYSAGMVNELLARFAGAGSPDLGGAVVLSPWAFRADVAWELLIGLGSVLLLRQEGREARRALDRSERKYRRLFEDSADGILVADEQYRVIDLNPSLRDALGMEERQVEELHLPELVDPEERDSFPPPERALGAEGIGLETVLRRSDGDTFPAALSMSGVRLDGRRVVQAIVRDVTERKELERELTRRALHHPLTDLPNRHHFDGQLEKALERLRRSGEPFGLLFADLDEFKTVNDTLGHSAGDELLREVAAALRGAVREADLPGHLGGDEFTVLLHGTETPREVKDAGQRILVALEGPYELGRGTARVSLSLGGAVAHRRDTSDELLHRADTAMYRAKRGEVEVPVLERESDASG